jgi:RNA polymerase sigma factor (sigma-70 family)
VTEEPAEGRQLGDAELAGRARDGDVSAYEELVTRHRELAFRVAWLITRSAGEAEDAVQEAFVKAWFALPRFRPGAPFRPWILRIVTNEAKNQLRSERRRGALALRESAEPWEPAPSPETAVIVREEAETLLRALGNLREPDRLILAYRWFFDLAEAEMAEALEIPVGTVKSRLSRAMARLRHELVREEVST